MLIWGIVLGSRRPGAAGWRELGFLGKTNDQVWLLITLSLNITVVYALIVRWHKSQRELQTRIPTRWRPQWVASRGGPAQEPDEESISRPGELICGRGSVSGISPETGLDPAAYGARTRAPRRVLPWRGARHYNVRLDATGLK